jgi:hypothetical protein
MTPKSIQLRISLTIPEKCFLLGRKNKERQTSMHLMGEEFDLNTPKNKVRQNQ